MTVIKYEYIRTFGSMLTKVRRISFQDLLEVCWCAYNFEWNW